MEKVISHLYEIEEKANHIVDSAIHEKEDLKKNLEESIHEFELQLQQKTEKELEIQKKKIEEEKQLAIKTMQENADKRLYELETNLKINYDKLIEDAFQSIIRM